MRAIPVIFLEVRVRDFPYSSGTARLGNRHLGLVTQVAHRRAQFVAMSDETPKRRLNESSSRASIALNGHRQILYFDRHPLQGQARVQPLRRDAAGDVGRSRGPAPAAAGRQPAEQAGEDDAKSPARPQHAAERRHEFLVMGRVERQRPRHVSGYGSHRGGDARKDCP